MGIEFTVSPLDPNFRKIGLPPDYCYLGNAYVIQFYFPKIMATFMSYNKWRFKILFLPIARLETEF